MPTPNYSFEKRKRDLAKKAKKEEKRLRKLEKGPGTGGGAIIGQEESQDPAPVADQPVVEG